MLPVSDDISPGERIDLRIGVSIDEPALYGFNGMVTRVEQLLPDSSLSKDVS